MPGQALYLKYRPRIFDDMIGQEHITRSLRNALAQNRIRHAYLFSGPRGTGKTTLARILAKAVNCLDPDPNNRPCDVCTACVAVNEGRYLDLIEIDAASNNGVDDVRDLRDKIGLSPNEGRFKVYVIDEVHRFTGAAFDALLKTLEEPPDHAIFILATTEMDKVPATIKSRCLKFEVRRVSLGEVVGRLRQIANAEGVQIDDGALEIVARQGTGSVRDSISLLDQLAADPTEMITFEMTERVLGTANNRAIAGLVGALIDNNVATGLDTINTALDEGADPRQFGAQIVDYLRNLLLTQTGSAAMVATSEEQRAVLAQQSGAIGHGALIRAVRLFNSALGDMRSSGLPQLPLELAFVESTRPIIEASEAAPANAAPRAKRNTPADAGPAPEPMPEVTEADAAGLTVGLGDIKTRWKEIVQAARHANQPIGAKFDHSEPKSLEGNLLTVVMINEPLFRTLNEQRDHPLLANTIYHLTGAKLRIKIVLGKTISGTDARAGLPDDLARLAQDIGIRKISQE